MATARFITVYMPTKDLASFEKLAAECGKVGISRAAIVREAVRFWKAKGQHKKAITKARAVQKKAAAEKASGKKKTKRKR